MTNNPSCARAPHPYPFRDPFRSSQSWHKKSIDKKVILIDDDVDDQDLLAEWGVISTLEGEGVIPADTEICLINEGEAERGAKRRALTFNVYIGNHIHWYLR
jgi:hypothetical protein